MHANRCNFVKKFLTTLFPPGLSSGQDGDDHSRFVDLADMTPVGGSRRFFSKHRPGRYFVDPSSLTRPASSGGSEDIMFAINAATTGPEEKSILRSCFSISTLNS